MYSEWRAIIKRNLCGFKDVKKVDRNTVCTDIVEDALFGSCEVN